MLITSVLFLNAGAFAQANASGESEAIRKTALDYIEGWHTGDAARTVQLLKLAHHFNAGLKIEGFLSPAGTKRSAVPNGTWRLAHNYSQR